MRKTTLTLLLASLAGFANAAVVSKTVPYEIDGEPYSALLVYDDAVTAPRPGLLMVPNWLGVTEASAKKAARVAADKYVVLVADLYGRDIRPGGPDEAKAVAGALRGDRPLMRKRSRAALEVLKRQPGVDVARIGAIGFCFGGGAILELARDGAPLQGFVSFHGNLDTPTPGDAAQIKAPLLVLHGADDPSVPPQQVDGFIAEMKAAKVDWQLVSYGGAVHSFTDPQADVPGRNQYNPLVATRAFKAMNDLFDEVFAR